MHKNISIVGDVTLWNLQSPRTTDNANRRIVVKMYVDTEQHRVMMWGSRNAVAAGMIAIG